MEDRSPNGLNHEANDSGRDAEIIESDESPGLDTEHVPAPAPHTGDEPPRAYELFSTFTIDAGDDAWLSAKYPVDVTEVQ